MSSLSLLVNFALGPRVEWKPLGRRFGSDSERVFDYVRQYPGRTGARICEDLPGITLGKLAMLKHTGKLHAEGAPRRYYGIIE
ncbi:MAG: hypothetical protein NUV51_03645 [Sulfuricaulis sp.]|nr:hypothetical protein [Sulfuricaulis sp.]